MRYTTLLLLYFVVLLAVSLPIYSLVGTPGAAGEDAGSYGRERVVYVYKPRVVDEVLQVLDVNVGVLMASDYYFRSFIASGLEPECSVNSSISERELYNMTDSLIARYKRLTSTIIYNDTLEDAVRFIILLDSYKYFIDLVGYLSRYPDVNREKWIDEYCRLRYVLDNLDNIAAGYMGEGVSFRNSDILRIIEAWRESPRYNVMYDFERRNVSSTGTFIFAVYSLTHEVVENSSFCSVVGMNGSRWVYSFLERVESSGTLDRVVYFYLLTPYAQWAARSFARDKVSYYTFMRTHPDLYGEMRRCYPNLTSLPPEELEDAVNSYINRYYENLLYLVLERLGAAGG